MGQKGCKSQRSGRTGQKQSSGHDRTAALMCLLQLCMATVSGAAFVCSLQLCMTTQSPVTWHSGLEGGKVRHAPASGWGTRDSWWQLGMKSQFSLSVWPPVAWPCSSGPTPMNIWATQIRITGLLREKMTWSRQWAWEKLVQSECDQIHCIHG